MLLPIYGRGLAPVLISFWLVPLVGCIPEYGLPEGAHLGCADDADCPEGWECSAASDECVEPSSNEAPVIEIGLIAHSVGVVTIPVTVRDSEGDEVTLEAILLHGGLEIPITISLESVASSAEGVTTPVTWNPAPLLNSEVLTRDLRIRLQPDDGTTTGFFTTSDPFDYGNSAPLLLDVDLLLAVPQSGGGQAAVGLAFADGSGDPVDITLFECAVAGGDFVAVDLDATHFPGSALTGLDSSGVGHVLIWDTSQDLPGQNAAVQVRVQLEDSHGALSEVVYSDPAGLDLDNRPTVVITGLWADDTTMDRSLRPLVDAYVSFYVGDPNAAPNGDQTVSVRFAFALSDPGATACGDGPPWHGPNGVDEDVVGGITAVGPTNEQRFLWHALDDALAGEGLTVESVDDTGDGNTDASIVAYRDQLWWCATPTDSTGVVGEDAVVDRFAAAGSEPERPFALGNRAPSSVLALIPGWPAGDVPLDVTLTDSASDRANIEVQFELGGVWHEAAIDAWALSDLATSPDSGGPDDGETYTLVWDSLADPADGGVGQQWVELVNLWARASDQADGATTIWGAWSPIQTIATIRNQTPPVFEEVVAPRSDFASGASPLAIQYRLSDLEDSWASLEVEYSHDFGVTWHRAREYLTSRSEGRHGLAMAQPTSDGAGGVWHTFYWDPTNATQAVPEGTRLRLTATDENLNPMSSSHELTLNHPAGPVGDLSNLVREVVQEFDETAGADSYRGQDLATADLNGDDVLDLVIVACNNALADAVFIQTGNAPGGAPDGTFTHAATVPLGREDTCGITGIRHLAVGDLNDDAIPDLAVTTRESDGDLRVFLAGDGGSGWDGTFAAPVVYGVGTSPRDVTIVELVGDASPDLLLSRNESEQLVLLTGSASGTLGSAHTFTLTGCSFGTCVPDSSRSSTAWAVGDLDDDGIIDLVASNGSASDEVSVYAGGGAAGLWTGGTGDPQSYDVGQGIASVVIEDFDWDGRPDLVTVSITDSRATFLKGNGDGTFAEARPLAFGPGDYPEEAAAADINNDGLIDLVVVDGSDRIYFLFNVGNASGDAVPFGPPVFVASSDPLNGLITGDFNGDARVDLAVGRSSDQIALYLTAAAGLSDTSFVPRYELDLHYSGTEPAAVDFNWDGILDAAVARTSWPTFLDGIGRGGVGGGNFEVRNPPAPVGGAMGLAAADFDLDGGRDLALAFAGFPSHEVIILLATSENGAPDGTFIASESVVSTADIEQIAVADIDGDGDSDLILLSNNFSSPALYVHLADPTTTPIFGNSTGYPITDTSSCGGCASSAAGAFEVTDINNDGVLDLAVAVSGNDAVPAACSYVRFFLGTPIGGPGDGGFQSADDDVTCLTGPSADVIAAADFNQDGWVDFAVAVYMTSSNLTLITGDGTASPDTSVVDPTGILARDLLPLDVTADGVVDLMVGNSSAGGFSVMLNDSATGGGLDLVDHYSLPIPATFSAAQHLAMGDLNADGHGDIVMTGSGPNTVEIWLGQLEMTTDAWSRQLGSFSAPGWVEVIGATTLPIEPDAAGDPVTIYSHIVQHRAVFDLGAGPIDVRGELHAAGFVPGALRPATHAWHTAGDLHLRRDPNTEDAPALRFRIENRFGQRVDPTSPVDRRREGLDLSDSLYANQRGLIIELPVLSALATGALTSGSLRLLHRTLDWRLATDEGGTRFATDPLHDNPAADGDYLPRIPIIGTSPVEYRDVFAQTVTWTEIAADDDGDFATGASNTGPRYILVTDDPSRRRIRVLTDRLGLFEAFY